MTKRTILTGLRANNDLHIGNYFGGMLPMIDMAKRHSDDYTINMFIPDLHSFTTPIDHSQLQSQIMHNARLFVAAGLPLDNDSIFLYRQSYIPAHSEMTWILDCFTGFGQMKRMTQFKDKSSQANHGFVKANLAVSSGTVVEADMPTTTKGIADKYDFSETQNLVSVGLFNYPVLMAADILLYNASYIPVGDDQSQHVEFARDIAERMNHRFGELFTVPEPVAEQYKFFGKDQGLRIKDLQTPTKKMSKSDETGKGVVFLGDEPSQAAKKIMSAETDSVGQINFDRDSQPGITNLLQILALLTDRDQAHVNAEWEGRERYGELKQAVADAVEVFLTDFQTKLATVDDTALLTKLESSETAMNSVANATLLRVQQAVGLRS